MTKPKRILVAPLNWGLGHATRCIPVINELIAHNFEPIIASDGVALALLRHEFPTLNTLTLPSYNITYAKQGKHFKLKMIWDSPKILNTMREEKKVIKAYVKKHQIDGIISDNRLGVHHKQIPCVFITHQLNVLTGNTSWITSKIHQKIIKKFDACWVPDVSGKPNLSGKLGHLKNSNLPVAYLGALSRFEKESLPISNQLLVLLSGPEPQRTLLADKLFVELQNFKGNILFIDGRIEATQKVTEHPLPHGKLTRVNFMKSRALQDAINQSEHVLCRSGYTTVLDLAKLNKKAFFIPTPGQYEQEYLAKRFHKKGMVPQCDQEDFTLEKLNLIADFTGLSEYHFTADYSSLFAIFSKVKENSDPTSSTLST